MYHTPFLRQQSVFVNTAVDFFCLGASIEMWMSIYGRHSVGAIRQAIVYIFGKYLRMGKDAPKKPLAGRQKGLLI